MRIVIWGTGANDPEARDLSMSLAMVGGFNVRIRDRLGQTPDALAALKFAVDNGHGTHAVVELITTDSDGERSDFITTSEARTRFLGGRSLDGELKKRPGGGYVLK